MCPFNIAVCTYVCIQVGVCVHTHMFYTERFIGKSRWVMYVISEMPVQYVSYVMCVMWVMYVMLICRYVGILDGMQ